jgi:hypothetical protein
MQMQKLESIGSLRPGLMNSYMKMIQDGRMDEHGSNSNVFFVGDHAIKYPKGDFDFECDFGLFPDELLAHEYHITFDARQDGLNVPEMFFFYSGDRSKVRPFIVMERLNLVHSIDLTSDEWPLRKASYEDQQERIHDLGYFPGDSASLGQNSGWDRSQKKTFFFDLETWESARRSLC